MEEIEYNGLRILKIEPINIPDEIDIEGIMPKQCTNNAKLIAENNHNVDYVEGIILVYFDDLDFYADLHAWNKIGDIHFDATLETLDYLFKIIGNEESILKREYFPYRTVHLTALTYNLEQTVVKFSNESNTFMNEMLRRYPKKK